MGGDSEPIRRAIEAADTAALGRLISEDAELVGAHVIWGPDGKNSVPPLHFVCDAVFRKLATQAEALAMANVLLDAGVDPNLSYAKSGDTFLIAASSLGAEDVGLRLVELGADPKAKGLFRATALHWCAMMGLPRLAHAVIDAGAQQNVPDKTYGATPLEWAQHAWTGSTNGNREQIPAVARILVAAGVTPGADMTEMLAANVSE